MYKFIDSHDVPDGYVFYIDYRERRGKITLLCHRPSDEDLILSRIPYNYIEWRKIWI